MTQSFNLLLFIVISIFLCFHLRYSSAQLIDPRADGIPDSDGRLNVGIVGGGASAAGASFYLRDLLGYDVDIDVVEAEPILGGRVRTLDFPGVGPVEMGAAVYHDSNRYFKDLVTKYKFEVRKPMNEGRMGIWNGSEILFSTSSYWGLSIARSLWRYGWSAVDLRRLANDAASKFTTIYAKQDMMKSFLSPTELLGSMDLYTATRVTLQSVLQSQNVSALVINELATGVIRVNYGQRVADINGFAGLVGLAGSGDSLFSVVGGNAQVIQQAINSTANVVHLNSRVVEIKRISCQKPRRDGKECRPTHKLKLENGRELGPFHALIIAAPFESLGDIVIDPTYNISPTFVMPREFQTTHATFVRGRLRESYFRMEANEDIPDNILTTENDTLIPFSSIGTLFRFPDGSRLFKIFSRQPLSEYVLASVLSEWDVSSIVHKAWQAYPVLSPPRYWSSFQISQQMFYVNTLETGASAIEIMLVAGRNVALLVCEALGKCNEGDVAGHAHFVHGTRPERTHRQKANDEF